MQTEALRPRPESPYKETDAIDKVIKTRRNPVGDIYARYVSREICKEQLETEVKRRCIDNIGNWYFPKKLIVREGWDQRVILSGLLAHNKSMKEWLLGLLEYSGADTEQGKISAKINDYSAEIYRQEEALGELRKTKAMVTSGVRI